MQSIGKLGSLLPLICLFLATGFLFLTYSRFGWVVFGLYILLGFAHFGKKYYPKIAKVGFYLVVLFPIFLVGAMFVIGENIDQIARLEILPNALVRSHSTAGHYKLTKIATQIIQKKAPILQGYGLGQSGPIAKLDYNKDIEKTPIIAENAEFADKLLVPRYEMAVPENWYLQLILNGGFVYAILYIFILYQLITRLQGENSFQFAIALAGFGILVGNLYLHIFESPVVVFYLGILAFAKQDNEIA
jgi:hypothetical protein